MVSTNWLCVEMISDAEAVNPKAHVRKYFPVVERQGKVIFPLVQELGYIFAKVLRWDEKQRIVEVGRL